MPKSWASKISLDGRLPIITTLLASRVTFPFISNPPRILSLAFIFSRPEKNFTTGPQISSKCFEEKTVPIEAFEVRVSNSIPFSFRRILRRRFFITIKFESSALSSLRSFFKLLTVIFEKSAKIRAWLLAKTSLPFLSSSCFWVLDFIIQRCQYTNAC